MPWPAPSPGCGITRPGKTSSATAKSRPSHAQSFPSQYANLLQRADYRFFSGDINGDGHIDVLAKSKLRIVMIDFDPAIPIVLKSPSPTFMLLSDSSGQYSLITSPPAATVASAIWRPNSHELSFGDVDGTGSVALLARARVAGEPSFVVVTSATNGMPLLRQHLTTTAIGVDISGPSVSLALTDTTRDGRADLIIRTDGRISTVLAANAAGLFVAPDTSQDRIIMAWNAFCASLDAADVASAANFIDEQSRPRYVPALNDLGVAITGVTTSWSAPKAVEVDTDYAVYSVVQTMDGRSDIHLALFIRVNGNWLLSDF